MSKEKEQLERIKRIVNVADRDIENDPKITYLAPIAAYYRIREILNESEVEA